MWSLKYFSGYNIVLLKKSYKIQKRWTELIFGIASNLVACSYSNIVLHNLDNICSFISSNKILIIIPHQENLFVSLIFNTRLWTCSQLFSISPMLGVGYYCFAITNSMMNIFFLFLLSLYYKFTSWVTEVIDINVFKTWYVLPCWCPGWPFALFLLPCAFSSFLLLPCDPRVWKSCYCSTEHHLLEREWQWGDKPLIEN